MMHRVVGILVGLCMVSCEVWSITVMSYNVENLFDWRHDSLKNDYEYTPTGLRHWTYSKYQHKCEQIARVVANVCHQGMPDIIGLCEVENDVCVQGLCYQLRAFRYRGLHRESEDERGIDVALLYRPETFHVIDSAAWRVDLGTDKTRDILYVAGVSREGDTLHLMMCHLPSMRGGAAASKAKRLAAKAVLQHKLDSIYAGQPNANVVIMGDMNSVPEDDLRGVRNRMVELQQQGLGSYCYQGQWTCLDQFYLSPSLDSVAEARIFNVDFLLERDCKYLGYKPKRTYTGYRYCRDGYSDHLPIVMTFKGDFY